MKSQRKPRLGQNFLVDTQAQARIVEALGPAAEGTVVEIGPGKGAVTERLAERAGRLIAIELDPALASSLRWRYQNHARVEIVEADVLSVNITALAREGLRELAVVGNLPYYITSPILHHLFTHERAIVRAVLMVQREVAERITARPGSGEYGLLSVLCRIHAATELLFALPPTAFSPPPEVHSAAVRMEFAPRWAELGVEPEPFVGFLQSCFAQKRKTLRNNLRAAGFDPARVPSSLADAGLSEKARAEELDPEQLAGLFRALRSA